MTGVQTCALPISPDNVTINKNLFSYCDNNPVIRKDDEGNCWWPVICAAVGGIAGAGTQILSNIALGKQWYSGAFGALCGGLAAGAVFGLTANPVAASYAGAFAVSTVSAISDYSNSFAWLNGTKATKELSFKNIRESINCIYMETALQGTINLGFSALAGRVIQLNPGWVHPVKLISCVTGNYGLKMMGNTLLQGIGLWIFNLFDSNQYECNTHIYEYK